MRKYLARVFYRLAQWVDLMAYHLGQFSLWLDAQGLRALGFNTYQVDFFAPEPGPPTNQIEPPTWVQCITLPVRSQGPQEAVEQACLVWGRHSEFERRRPNWGAEYRVVASPVSGPTQDDHPWQTRVIINPDSLELLMPMKPVV